MHRTNKTEALGKGCPVQARDLGEQGGRKGATVPDTTGENMLPSKGSFKAVGGSRRSGYRGKIINAYYYIALYNP